MSVSGPDESASVREWSSPVPSLLSMPLHSCLGPLFLWKTPSATSMLEDMRKLGGSRMSRLLDWNPELVGWTMWWIVGNLSPSIPGECDYSCSADDNTIYKSHDFYNMSYHSSERLKVPILTDPESSVPNGGAGGRSFSSLGKRSRKDSFDKFLVVIEHIKSECVVMRKCTSSSVLSSYRVEVCPQGSWQS